MGVTEYGSDGVRDAGYGIRNSGSMKGFKQKIAKGAKEKDSSTATASLASFASFCSEIKKSNERGA
jgi:hypothetical protein